MELMKSYWNLRCQGPWLGKLYILPPSRQIPSFFSLAWAATHDLALLCLSSFISSPPTSATESSADLPATGSYFLSPWHLQAFESQFSLLGLPISTFPRLTLPYMCRLSLGGTYLAKPSLTALGYIVLADPPCSHSPLDVSIRALTGKSVLLFFIPDHCLIPL